MKKILFVGENPLGQTGNSHMMRAILSQLDTEKYEAACFASVEPSPADYDAFTPTPFSIIPARHGEDLQSGKKLLGIIEYNEIDILLFVGIDIWMYAPHFPELVELKKRKGFKWAAIFPYDIQGVRKDWVNWIRCFDYPFVYSKYGEAKLREVIPNIRYYRPPLDQHEIFVPAEENARAKLRATYLPSVKKDGQFIFGFIGKNQFRKDPQKLITAFEIVKKALPNSILYLHIELKNGVFNLKQRLEDGPLVTGDVLVKKEGVHISPQQMVDLINAFDTLVNCSLQEGLSWTLVEAMLCGTPVIATDTTSQTELIKDVGILVPCEEPAHLIQACGTGQTWMDAKQCKAEDLAEAMILMATDDKLRKECIDKGLKKGKLWVDGIDDINDALDEIVKAAVIPNVASGDTSTEEEAEGVRKHTPPVDTKKDIILFAQHSAAGDVLMTTRCLKGLRERHGGMQLAYMTSPQYMDILKGNPDVAYLLSWNIKVRSEYDIIYDPHGTRIAPGHWGRNSNSILSDFYWKILLVDPDDFFIEKVRPPDAISGVIDDISKPICIVHTTGGDSHFRTYKYMGDVCEALRNQYFTVQLGGAQDFPGWSDLDLRGKLTFRESAWVMDKASLSVNVDSFISHLAGALGISQVTLFGSGNANVTRPNQMKGELICLSPDYVRDCVGLGPCSAAVRECPAPCTGKVSPKTILESILEIEEHGMVRRNTEHEHSRYSLKFSE